MNKFLEKVMRVKPFHSDRCGMLAAELDRFWREHRLDRRTIDGVEWQYITSGSGDQPNQALVLLPGGPGRAQTSWQYIQALEGSYRIVAPSYPAEIVTAAGLVDGLAALFHAEGIERVHLVGGSYSGLIAQCFVRRHPKLVASLILTNTGVPWPSRGTRLSLLAWIVKRMPMAGVRQILRLGVAQFLTDAGEERPFWRAYFKALIASLSRNDCVSRLRVWIDIDRHYRFASGDLCGWDGPILLIEADDDTMFPARERAALRSLYPQAVTVRRAEGGHAASLVCADAYARDIAAFVGQERVLAQV